MLGFLRQDKAQNYIVIIDDTLCLARSLPAHLKLRDEIINRRRLTGLIKQSWLESGCVYGYRKIHHHLLSLGERCAPNTVATLMHLIQFG